MKKRSVIINLIIMLVVTGLTFFYLFKSNLLDNISVIKDVPFISFLFLFLFVIIYSLADMLIIHRSLNKIKPNTSFNVSVGTYLMGNLGSGVTPYKSGHFPSIAIFIKQKGFTIEETFAVMIRNQIVYSVTNFFLYLTFAIIALVNNFTLDVQGFILKIYLVCIFGSVTNATYIIFLLFVTYNKVFQNLVINLEGKFKLKFKKITSIEEFKKEKLIKMQAYKTCFDSFIHKTYEYIPSMLLYVVFMVTFFTLPYFIYLTLAKTNDFSFMLFLYYFTLSQAMGYVTNIIPVPGGTGVAEFTFLIAFSAVMGDNYVTAAMIIYRLITYFIMIIIDFIYFAIYMILKNRKNYEEK